MRLTLRKTHVPIVWVSLCLATAGCGTFMGNPSSRKDADKGGGTEPKPQNISLTDAEIRRVFSPATGTFLDVKTGKPEPQASCTAKAQLSDLASELAFAKIAACLISKRNLWNKRTALRLPIEPAAGAPAGAPTEYLLRTNSKAEGNTATIQFCFEGKKPDYLLNWQRNGEELSGTVVRIEDRRSGDPLYSVGMSSSDGKSANIDLFGIRTMHYSFKVKGSETNIAMHEGSDYTSHQNQVDRRYIEASFSADSGSLRWLIDVKYDVDPLFHSELEMGKLKFNREYAQIAKRTDSRYAHDKTKLETDATRVSLRLPSTVAASKESTALQKGGDVYVSQSELPAWDRAPARPQFVIPEWDCATEATIDLDQATLEECGFIKSVESCDSQPRIPGRPRPAGEEDLTD